MTIIHVTNVHHAGFGFSQFFQLNLQQFTIKTNYFASHTYYTVVTLNLHWSKLWPNIEMYIIIINIIIIIK